LRRRFGGFAEPVIAATPMALFVFFGVLFLSLFVRFRLFSGAGFPPRQMRQKETEKDKTRRPKETERAMAVGGSTATDADRFARAWLRRARPPKLKPCFGG
jgi:hypothetical protein